MPALDLLRHELIVDPAIAVAGDLPIRCLHRLHRGGIAGQRHGDSEDRDRHLALGEKAVEAPESSAAAVFIDQFHVHVPHPRQRLGPDDLGQEGFGGGVAMENVVLAAFLVIDDELQGEPRFARPLRVRGQRPVAAHVPRITREFRR